MQTFMLAFLVPTLSISLFVIYSVFIAIFRWILTKESIKHAPEEETVSTLVILGSGGHTSEMLRLISVLDHRKYDPKMFMVADTDNSSMNKLNNMNCDDKIFVIPRSREVGQSWISTIMTSLKAITYCLPVLWKHRPKLILCNGPGTCVPPCLVAWLFNKLLGQKTKIDRKSVVRERV